MVLESNTPQHMVQRPQVSDRRRKKLLLTFFLIIRMLHIWRILLIPAWVRDLIILGRSHDCLPAPVFHLSVLCIVGTLMTISDDEDQKLHRLIYASRAAPHIVPRMPAAFAEIFRAGLNGNREVDITGALLACDTWFLQLLEGPRIQVWRTFQRIAMDSRHRCIYLVKAEPMEEREFAGWSLCGGRLSQAGEIMTALQNGRKIGDPELLSPQMARALLRAIRDVQASSNSRKAWLEDPAPRLQAATR